MSHREGELEFDFTGARVVDRLDQQGVPLPHGMQLVDFVVEETNRLLLVEVKDPSAIGARPERRATWEEELRDGSFVNAELAPKCRDSYTYLHLMDRDDRPIAYLVVLGLCNMPGILPADLDQLAKRLSARLKQEADQPWVRQYASACQVVTVADWNSTVGRYSVARVP